MAGDRSGVLGPGLVLGAGLGGFVDGIVLHQILRWHHLVSEVPGAGLTANLIADGLFHAGTWLAVVVGVIWLWARLRAGVVPRAWTALTGPVLAGWGIFNLVEGTVNHHVLGLHHVRPGPDQAAYDVAFLLLGAALLAAGTLLYRRGGRARRDAGTGPGGVA